MDDFFKQLQKTEGISLDCKFASLANLECENMVGCTNCRKRSTSLLSNRFANEQAEKCKECKLTAHAIKDLETIGRLAMAIEVLYCKSCDVKCNKNPHSCDKAEHYLNQIMGEK